MGGFDFEDGIENYHDSEVIVSTYFQPCNNVRMKTNNKKRKCGKNQKYQNNKNNRHNHPSPSPSSSSTTTLVSSIFVIRPFVGPAWTAQLHGYPRTPAERPAKSRAVDGGRGRGEVIVPLGSRSNQWVWLPSGNWEMVIEKWEYNFWQWGLQGNDHDDFATGLGAQPFYIIDHISFHEYIALKIRCSPILRKCIKGKGKLQPMFGQTYMYCRPFKVLQWYRGPMQDPKHLGKTLYLRLYAVWGQYCTLYMFSYKYLC